MDLMVAVGTDTNSRPYAVYYGGPGRSAGRPVDSAQDLLPVSMEVFKPAANSVPTSRARMAYLLDQAAGPVQAAYLANFGRIDLSKDLPAERGVPGRWIVRLKSIVLCPEDGVYRLALDCRDAGFVWVDGEPAAECPGEHDAGEWQEGPALSLKAGPHRIEALTMTRSPIVVRLGWRLPGRGEIAPIPHASLLTAREVSDPRVETMTQPLQPDFAFTLMPAYSLRGGSVAFIPVSFTNTTQYWVTNTVRCRWRFGSGPEAEGESVTRVFASPGRYPVTMEVRDALGFVGTCEKTVDCRQVQPRQYAAAADLIDLPATCYVDDQVSPRLLLTGSLPGSRSVDVQWEIQTRSGGRTVLSNAVVLAGEPVRIPLTRMEAGDLASIVWHVKHGGADVASGTVKFMTPPFDEFPARVVGDSLFGSSGNQLVLLPYRHAGAFAQQPISTRQAFGKILCVDDFLASPELPGVGTTPFHRTLARMVDGSGKPVIAYASPPIWEKCPEAYGPLLKLVHVPAAVSPDMDVVVLSVGLRDFTELKETAAFERQIAALSDLVAVSMKRRLIWVTPPPYPGQSDRVREFAAAIRRVADARRIPVADLYTTFCGARDDVSPFVEGQDLVLSEAGQSLAAQMIARALLQE